MSRARVATARAAGWSALCAVLLAPAAAIATSDPGLQQRVRAATFEVVLPKPADEKVTYERPLPLELIPYAERNDRYWSMGTAFAIGPGRYASAAHVLLQAVGAQFGAPGIRDAQGKVHVIDRVLQFSLHEDFIVFSVAGSSPAAQPLDTNTRPAIDDPVLAVGNALGEGVVIRSGLLTSFTPEAQDGRWNWLRYSAATSPGNSGGPLLDATGKVIGIVIGKSPDENLNYALPIDRVLADRGTQARIDKVESVRFAMLRDPVVARHADQFGLPLPFAAFSGALTDSFDRFYRKLMLDRLGGPPFGNGSAGELFATVEENTLPSLVLQDSNAAWQVAKLTSLADERLPDEGRIRFASANPAGLTMFRLQPGKRFRASRPMDSRQFMDLLLKGLSLPRTVGTQAVRVTSLGSAQGQQPYDDTFGRRWSIQTWSLGFAEAYVVAMSLPTPEGFAGITSLAPSGQLSLAIATLQALASYFHVSYSGTLAQWQDFLAAGNLRPRVLDDLMLDFDASRGLRLASRRLRIDVPRDLLALDAGSQLDLPMTYVHDGKAVWDIGGVRLQPDPCGGISFGAFRQAAPPEDSNKELRDRWRDMKARRGKFDGAAGHDDSYGKLWAYTSIGSPGQAATAPDPSARVLYELFYETDEKLFPQEFAARRRRLFDAVRILER